MTMRMFKTGTAAMVLAASVAMAPGIAHAAPGHGTVFVSVAADTPTIVADGATHQVVFRVTRDGSRPVAVTLATADGTARAGIDYVATSRRVILSKRNAVVTVPVTILRTAAAGRTFSARLSKPTRAATLWISDATVTLASGPILACSVTGSPTARLVSFSFPNAGSTVTGYRLWVGVGPAADSLFFRLVGANEGTVSGGQRTFSWTPPIPVGGPGYNGTVEFLGSTRPRMSTACTDLP
jgi:Calx-beta domain-containing protein